MLHWRQIGGELAKALSVLAIVFLSFGHQNPPGLVGVQGPVLAPPSCGTPAPGLPLGGGDAHDHGCPVHHIGNNYVPALAPAVPLPRASDLLVAMAGPVSPAPYFDALDWSSPPRAPPLM